MIFSLPRKKDPYFDITPLFGKKEPSSCPECGGTKLEPWRPERSFFASLARHKRVRLRDGALVVCDHKFFFVRAGISVRHLGIVHIEDKRPVCSRARLFVSSGNCFLLRPYINLYVSCAGQNPVAFEGASQRAQAALKDTSITFSNGHAFLAWCLTGEVPREPNYSFAHLEYLMGRISSFDSWVAYRKV
ncbi:MAG: hypothetical protein IJU76_03340 [Desulfovibrionaceae bacterium]|nr:hypothetical protein [Desulfovibrionaceae bacterium]